MKNSKIIFSDFDGTLTSGPNLGPLFFELIEFLHQRKIDLIIVTGRPLSWAHFLLTHTPLKIVVAESGGVICSKVRPETFKEEFLVSAENLNHLKLFSSDLLKRFPGLRLTNDSLGRISDRAIELEHLKELALEEEILSFMRMNQISFSKSSVHLNFWSGRIEKSLAIKKTIERFYPDFSDDDLTYFGDALNDESVFKSYKNTVGVSNIARFLDQMTYKPSVVLKGEENAGVQGVFNHLKSLFK